MTVSNFCPRQHITNYCYFETWSAEGASESQTLDYRLRKGDSVRKRASPDRLYFATLSDSQYRWGAFVSCGLPEIATCC